MNTKEAAYIVSVSDFKRLFGSQWKHKRVIGTVMRAESRKGSKVIQRVFGATWEILSRKFYKGILLRNVVIGKPLPRDSNGNILHHGRYEEDDVVNNGVTSQLGLASTRTEIPEADGPAPSHLLPPPPRFLPLIMLLRSRPLRPHARRILLYRTNRCGILTSMSRHSMARCRARPGG